MTPYQQLLSAALKRRQPSQPLFDSRQALGLQITCDSTTRPRWDTTTNNVGKRAGGWNIHSTNQMRITFRSRGSLLEWSLSPSESKQWHALDANRRQVLFMITLTLYLWSKKYYTIILTLHLWSSSQTRLTVSSPQGVFFHRWNQFQPSLHFSFGKSVRLHDNLEWAEFIEEGSWYILAGPF